MANYVSFFVPARKTRSSLGATMLALPRMSVAPMTSTQITTMPIAKGIVNPQAPSSGVAEKILDIGPMGMIGLVAVAAVAGYFVMRKVSK